MTSPLLSIGLSAEKIKAGCSVFLFKKCCKENNVKIQIHALEHVSYSKIL